jgi:hypothetical protein
MNSEIASVIEMLVERYVEMGDNAREINSGLCEEFAHDVHKHLQTSSQASARIVYTEDFEANGGGWNWGCAGPGGYVVDPPALLSQRDLEDVSGGHCWVMFEGRHYDSETSHGVKNFFELPFFQRAHKNLCVKNSPSYSRLK